MLLRRLDDELPHHPSLRIENNSLVVGPLKAKDEQPSLAALEALVDARLPLIELPDLLMEVDGWTGFSRHFGSMQVGPSLERRTCWSTATPVSWHRPATLG